MAALSAAVAAGVLTSSVSADEAYYGYNYNWWNDPVPSQNGYIVDRVVTGVDIGVGPLNTPSDIFIEQTTGKIYIVDTNNNRIVITDESFDPSKATELKSFRYGEEFPESQSKVQKTELSQPMGVFVMVYKEQTLIYIADYMNERVIGCYEDGTIFREYTKPSSDLYEANISFRPEKVVVDNALNVYAVIPSITNGMVQFSYEGNFNGYYGANRVETTAEVLQNAFYSLFMNRDQMMKRQRAVAIEIANCDIDAQGFIYTVTSSKNADKDILKKLNPAGENIYLNMGFDDMLFGDVATYYNGQTYASVIDDVDVDENGNVFLLDFFSKRIFQYSNELDLEFIFGGEGNQKGLFTSPTAVENRNGKVYVTDGRKNSITIFKLTEFGAMVQEAVEMFNKGLYQEAKEPFEEILLRDSNYWFAYVGLGNAYYTMGEHETAMKYFYMNSKVGYNRAFKEYRMDMIRQYFNVFMIAVLVLIVLAVVISKAGKIMKKRKEKAAQAAAGGDGDAV
ncbi:MAG: hypothetical protein J1F60_05265 [Oscillospiraceae bacterium]|nr:hypothetical protein [Oscillospiraceae bacterium]